MLTRIASLALVSALAGCTTSLETRPVSLGQNRIDGVPYALPVLSLETKVTHRLTACKVVLPGTAGFDPALSGLNSPNLVVEFETTLENKAEYPAAEYFVLDYSALAAATKSSSFKVTFHDNRMLSAINVSADDQTVDFAVATLKAGIAVAGLAAGVPVPLGAPAFAADPPVACPTAQRPSAVRGANGEIVLETVPMIDLRKTVAGQRKAAVEALADTNATLAALNARNPATLSPTDQAQITTLTGQGKTLADRIKSFDRQVAEFDKTLAYTETLHWQPPGTLPSSRVLAQAFPFTERDSDDMARGAARRLWLTELFNPNDHDDFEDLFGAIDPAQCTGEGCQDNLAGPRIARALTINFRLQPDHVVLSPSDARDISGRLGISTLPYDPSNESRYINTGSKRDHVRGVVARQPIRGDLIVCTGFNVPCTASAATKVLDEAMSVPQLGAYIILPFSSGVAENNALNATFAQTGEPTMVEYKENSAAALEVAQGISTGANSLNSFLQAAETAREADRTAALGEPLAELQRQAAVLQQQQAIANLQEQISPTNPVTLLQRQVAIMEQQVRITQLEAQLNPQVDAYQQRLDELRKELELLKLQVQIAQQQGMLGGG